MFEQGPSGPKAPLILSLVLAISGTAFAATENTPSAGAMLKPASGSTLSGSTVTFTWSAGASATGYRLYLGTTGRESFNIYKSGTLAKTSVTVRNIPTDGVTLYATLFSKIRGSYVPETYKFTEAGTPAAAVMISPAPGATFTGSAATFTWTKGAGPTAYYLYLGSTAGASDIFKSGVLAGTSVAVSSLPISGKTVYATLFSRIDGSWKPAHYTYTEEEPPTPATMIKPAAGSALTSSTVTFTWTAGNEATAYWLYLGTTGPRSADVYNSGGLSGTSVTVGKIPANGVNLYATLFSKIGGTYQPVDYVFTEAGTMSLAAMTGPAAGSTFSGTSATFTWSKGAGPTAYDLYLGTTGPGSANLYNSRSITTNTVTVSGLPLDGVTVYATLFSQINGAWQPVHYTYTESKPAAPATMISPVAGTKLSSSSATFTWTAGSQTTAYWLYLGTTGARSSNIYNSGALTGTSVTVNNLPANGVNLYVTLFSKIDGTYQPVNYVYTQSGTPSLAALTSPAPNSTLTASSATFAWTPGAGPTAYILYLGTTGVGSWNLLNSGATTATSFAFTGLPMDGATIYATLFSQVNGAWQPVHYTYTEAKSATPATMISPVAGTKLTGSSATFTWTTGSQATAYWLYLGTTGAGSANIYNSGGLTGTSVTVNNLPTNGVNLYATLFSKINGTYQPVNYVYTQFGTSSLAALTSPAPNSILATSSATFAWTPGTGPTAYILYLGTTGVGSWNLLNSGATTGTSFAFAGLPTNGATIYATLFSEINGAWQPVHYTLTAEGGAGEPAVSKVSCGKSSFTGSGTVPCTLTLNKATGSSSLDVLLSSNNAAVTVPAMVTVPANSSSVSFTAAVAAVTTAQVASLTATSDSVSASFALSLVANVPTLKVSASTLSFGDVTLKALLGQSLTLTSSGALPLTISSASATGSGFSWSGATFPMTLNPGQSVTITVAFDPLVSGTANGVLTLASNSSTGSSTLVNLSGAGKASSYQVQLNWIAPTDPTLPITGYFVHRSTGGGSYTLLNPSPDTSTGYADITVQSGVTYDYYIESVDTNNVTSAPSAVFSITVP